MTDNRLTDETRSLRASAARYRPDDEAWVKFTGRLIDAFLASETRGFTGGGDIVAKTQKQWQIDGAVFEALARVASDWPGQPLGMTTTAVLLNLRALRIWVEST